MRKVKSCGVLVFREHPRRAFLLMRHPHRYDLPKGHIDDGETEQQCALREMEEETGLPADLVTLDPNFRFETVYFPREWPGFVVHKTLVVFLGRLAEHAPTAIRPTEHSGFEWIYWSPPHRYQSLTIDPLMESVEQFFASNAGGVNENFSKEP